MSDKPIVNPKTNVGAAKPSISKIPPSALIYAALAMMNGAQKYGPYNFRDSTVPASIYIDAAMRHILSWWDGEENASDSQVPHLGHAIASLAILIDALESGTLTDDRPTKGPCSTLLEEWTPDSNKGL